MQGIPGFDSYAIDRCGNVFRVLTKAGKPCDPRPLKPIDNGKGYHLICLRKHGKTYRFSIHRLVATVYIGDPTGFDVCHWNHIRNDNRVENLYIGTRQENTKQSGREGRYGWWRKGVPPVTKKLTPELIQKIKADYATGDWRQVDLAKKYRLSQKTVSDACRA